MKFHVLRRAKTIFFFSLLVSERLLTAFLGVGRVLLLPAAAPSAQVLRFGYVPIPDFTQLFAAPWRVEVFGGSFLTDLAGSQTCHPVIFILSILFQLIVGILRGGAPAVVGASCW